MIYVVRYVIWGSVGYKPNWLYRGKGRNRNELISNLEVKNLCGSALMASKKLLMPKINGPREKPVPLHYVPHSASPAPTLLLS